LLVCLDTGCDLLLLEAVVGIRKVRVGQCQQSHYEESGIGGTILGMVAKGTPGGILMFDQSASCPWSSRVIGTAITGNVV